MDSVLFQAMAIELNRKLSRSRLDKVVQTGAGTLVLKFWTGQEKLQLLFKAEGRSCFYLTRESYSAPAKPPRICQLLRARLRNLLEVRTEPFDRIAHFTFLGPEKVHYDLIFEAFGPQGNLILVGEDGRIVDLLYRQEGKRKMLPGEIYELPQQKPRISLLDDIPEAVNALQQAEQDGDLSRADVAPFSPALAYAITQSRQAGQSFDAIITRIKDVFTSGWFSPQKLVWDGQSGLLPLTLAGQDPPEEGLQDLSVLIEASLSEEAGESVKDLTARLSAVVSKQRKRLAKRLEHISAESERQADPERFRILGDLLLANLHIFKRGADSVEVEDYYQSPSVTVTIELDSKATPQENAEHYFKLYRKAKRSGDHHARRLQDTKEEQEWLDQVELSLEEAKGGDDLYQVQLELETAGMLKQTKGQLGRRQQVKPEDQLYKAFSPSGWQLYWGKNSRTNDYVSRNMTGPKDLWFHAKGMPGSHLVLKCGDSADKVSEEDLHYAAAFAAGYSKGKDDGKVEVIVAQGRDVKKPKGARPGLVTVDSYYTVMVAPRRLED
ncbi:MAG: NFACT family protein [Desulfuromonadales bacterium]|nr:NFACT family protein [Desulfuromonadales bacterium]